MTEYYPLLAKAVASLPNSTSDTRRAVYERARKALLGQLQSLQPPVPEADVARERQALDDAVARLEAELKEKNGAAGNAAAAPQVPPPPSPMSTAPNVARPAPAPPRAAQPKAPPRAPVPPGAPLQRQRPIGVAPEQSANVATPPTSEKPATPEVKKEEVKDGASDASTSPPPAAPKPRPEAPRPEVSRPYLPQPEIDDAPYRRRLWIVIAVVVVVVGMVAAAAWKLRDRPEDFASFKPASQSQNEPGGGKIVERAPGGDSQQQQASQQPTSPPSTQPPASQQQSASEEAPAQAPATIPQKPAESTPGVPIAYRAALLVEAPDEPNKVKTYVGTVIWRNENVNSDSGQPLGTAVRADIDIPDDKLKASMEIQKNTDASLSASHTITLIFNVAPDSPTGAIKQISVPQLRREDNPNGAPLRGILVPIMDNSFLIGLTRGDAEAGNLAMIKELEWFDVPILLANGHVAKLTFEKNTAGSRAIEDALASWQAQQ